MRSPRSKFKLTLFLLSLLITLPAVSREATETEKYVFHFVISAGVGYLTENIIHNKYDTASKRIITASAIAMIPGLAKEVYDELDEGSTHFSEMDILADAAGAFLGAYTANRLNQRILFTFGKSDNTTLIGFKYSD